MQAIPFHMPATYKEEVARNFSAIFSRWRWVLHLLLWCVVGVLAQLTGQASFDHPFSVYFLTLMFCTIGFSYTFLLLVVPLCRFQKALHPVFWGMFADIVLWWVVLFVLRRRYYHFNLHDVPEIFQQQPALILGYSLGQMLIVGWSFFAIYYFIDLYDQQKGLNRYESAIADKLKAELALLQQQINPHFLFNTLNNIYLLVLKQDQASAAVIGRLKSLLDYMLNDCTQEQVLLDDEITFIKNYISLERLRIREKEATIDFQVKGNTSDIKIAPLLLINFVENAFKHGVKGGVGHANLDIELSVSGNKLEFIVRNSKQLLQDANTLSVKSVGGIGNVNVARRLQILYPGKHELNITETDREYISSLQLTIAQ
ncbi:sensor histidine kinase [Taibaiella soli]|nr:histidine kinase [Taibaiella soli]